MRAEVAPSLGSMNTRRDAVAQSLGRNLTRAVEVSVCVGRAVIIMIDEVHQIHRLLE